MATTTNYGWDTPDDTDLVKDGAAAIRTLGSSVDTTTKALNPSTTLGDIEYRSATANTNTRLGIGTAGQILKVNSGATAPEWATASASALTKISTTTFSNVATQDIDSVFTSTYNSYVIAVSAYAVTAANDLHLQFRHSTTTKTAGYFGSIQSYPNAGTSALAGTNAGTFCLLNRSLGQIATQSTMVANVYFGAGGGISGLPQVYGQFYESHNGEGGQFQYANDQAEVYTGFRLKSSSTNISGTVVVYGMEK
jgi:hypothetical protein